MSSPPPPATEGEPTPTTQAATSTYYTTTSAPDPTHRPGGPLHYTLVYELTATITILEFPTPVPLPLQDYHPAYTAHLDGSITTDIYTNHLAAANLRLLFVSLLLAFFVHASYTAADYIRRCRAKDKTLFYLLLASQVLGPVSFGLQLSGWFNDAIDCTIASRLSVFCMTASLGLLITGILGIKTYRVFNKARFVLMVIAALQVAATIVFLLDMPNRPVPRSLTGDCEADSNLTLLPVSVLFNALQAFFVCTCLLYATWRLSRRSSPAQGRISLALSLSPSENIPIPPPECRGWWDYVPQKEGPPPPPPKATPHTEPRGLAHRIGSSIALSFTGPPANVAPSPQRKSSTTSMERPLPQPRQYASLTEKPPSVLSRGRPSVRTAGSAPPMSLTPDTITVLPTTQPSPAPSRLPRGAPRILLMRSVLRDELFHTLGILVSLTVFTLVLLLEMPAAVYTLGPSVWIGFSWAVTSLIVLHSFGQVVRRHEREAILQTPAAWEAMAGLEGATRGGVRQETSSLPISSLPARRRRLGDDEESWVEDSPFNDWDRRSLSAESRRQDDSQESSPAQSRRESLLPTASPFATSLPAHQRLTVHTPTADGSCTCEQQHGSGPCPLPHSPAGQDLGLAVVLDDDPVEPKL